MAISGFANSPFIINHPNIRVEDVETLQYYMADILKAFIAETLSIALEQEQDTSGPNEVKRATKCAYVKKSLTAGLVESTST